MDLHCTLPQIDGGSKAFRVCTGAASREPLFTELPRRGLLGTHWACKEPGLLDGGLLTNRLRADSLFSQPVCAAACAPLTAAVSTYS